MSRPIIAGAVAALIALLTAVAFFVTTSSLEGRIEKDVRLRVAKAQELLVQNSSLEMLGLLKRTEALAREPDLLKALVAGTAPNPRQAETAFQRFRAGLAAGEARPDIMALTDEQGKLVALITGDTPIGRVVADTYLKDGKIKYPALARALQQRQITSEVWDYETAGPMKVGVSPIFDPDVDNNVAGAIILAYAMSAQEAKQQQKLLGTDVGYFYGGRVSASSFGAAGGKDKAGSKNDSLGKALFDASGPKLAAAALSKEGGGLAPVVAVTFDGEDYWATAGRMPRFSTQPFPADYPDAPAGAMVMMSRDEAMQSLGGVKIAILMLGVGAIVVALLGLFLTARRILHPLDEIETGINDIINGNLERTFADPVGSDLDGLANALNVMLARLLGRPEPGEEEYDDEGNVIRTGALAVDTEGLSARDAEAVKLAAEPEESYLKRTFDEYVAARNQTGEGTKGLTYDVFVAKLRQNEVTLRAKYQSSAVRFKVVTAAGKVTLKPVPIV